MIKQPLPRYPFEDFITDTRQARTGADLFGLLQRAVAQYGYDQVILSTPFDPELEADYQKFGLFNTYPDEFIRLYDDQNFVRYDPVVRAAALNNHAFRWQDMNQIFTLSDAQTRMISMADDMRMFNGMCVPLHGRHTLLAGVAMASSTKDRAPTDAQVDMINALCIQFYSAFKKLHARPASAETAPSLSSKQSEILKWVASGKTDEEIATILNISRNTVDSHMRQIFHKLNAVNRVTAVVTGLTKGHITL